MLHSLGTVELFDLGLGFLIACNAKGSLKWAYVAAKPTGPPTGPSSSPEEVIKLAAELLPPDPWAENVWQEWTSALKEKTGRKGKALFMPLRKVLTGETHGPDLGQFLPVIGREGTLRRLP